MYAVRFSGFRHAAMNAPPIPPLPPSPVTQLCASIYPDFQASSCHEHLCFELTTGARSPARLPPGPPDQSDFDPLPPPTPPLLGSAPGVRGVRALSTDRATSKDSAEPPASPPTRAQAPPPLRQKMLQQQQQMRLQQGGGGTGGAGVGGGGGGGSGERPRSPFAFLGGGSPSRERETDRAAAAAAVDTARRSSAQGLSGGAGGNGSSRADELAPSAPNEDAVRVVALPEVALPAAAVPAARGGDGRAVGAVSGPQFDVLWRASRGWVLEKVMRKVELPSHVSRHRPPWDKADQGRAEGRRGGRSAVEPGALSRTGSSPVLCSGEVLE